MGMTEFLGMTLITLEKCLPAIGDLNLCLAPITSFFIYVAELNGLDTTDKFFLPSSFLFLLIDIALDGQLLSVISYIVGGLL